MNSVTTLDVYGDNKWERGPFLGRFPGKYVHPGEFLDIPGHGVVQVGGCTLQRTGDTVLEVRVLKLVPQWSYWDEMPAKKANAVIKLSKIP